MPNNESKFKSGYVALIGKPNVGKSTLMNAMLGEELSIVTKKPQTTRHKIAGILNRKGVQVVFLDTPGFHKSRKLLNIAMNDVVDSVIDDADVVCLLVSADQKDLSIEEGLIKRIGLSKCILVINKSDLITKEKYDGLAKRYKELWSVQEIIILSAVRGDGVDVLVDSLVERLPEGPAYFPDDVFTDRSVRFLAAELIREQLFLQMQQEIPYSTAIEIEDFKDPTEDDLITRITASIVVEKASQKAMIIGKGGKRIKQIGTEARKKIEELA
ncbi:MAG: GTPase Era, partial [Deltaproteobacteria bacterium]|nr:GTPase Era [Deltaproteobacteria bacterium]